METCGNVKREAMRPNTNQRNKMKNVTLKTWAAAEYYHGEPTGKTVWRAEAVNTFTPWNSVLGRGDTEAQAVQDWTRRAQDDGHQVVGEK